MKHIKKHAYHYVLYKDKNSNYGIEFPDFKGVFSAGETLDECQSIAQECLELHIKDMIENQEPLPYPTSIRSFDDDVFKKDLVGVGTVKIKFKKLIKQINQERLSRFGSGFNV